MGKFLEALSASVIPKRLREAGSYPEIYAMGGDPDTDAHLYRPLSGGVRDMSQTRLDRAASISFWLWTTNPYAKRGLDILGDFIIGSGATIEAEDENVQELLEEFWWGDPWNFDLHLKEYLDVLHLFGELVFPFKVNPVNGQVSLAYIDPANIKRIELNPENYMLPEKLYIKGLDQEKFLPIVQSIDQKVKAKAGDEPDGVFLMQINKLINAERGMGMLLSTIDILTSLDDFTFSEIERTMLLRNFVWDVTLEGYDENKLIAWSNTNEAKPPKPGSVRAHNEKATWAAVTPDLKHADSETLFKILQNTIATGLAIPLHWISAGTDINRSTAIEMGSPVYKRFDARQKNVRSFYELMCDFVIQQAVLHKRRMSKGIINEKTDTSYVLQFPEVSSRDMASQATTLNQLVQSLSLAESSKWISKTTASQIAQSFLEREMGFEIPEDDTPDEGPDNGTDETIGMYKEVDKVDS